MRIVQRGIDSHPRSIMPGSVPARSQRRICLAAAFAEFRMTRERPQPPTRSTRSLQPELALRRSLAAFCTGSLRAPLRFVLRRRSTRVSGKPEGKGVERLARIESGQLPFVAPRGWSGLPSGRQSRSSSPASLDPTRTNCASFIGSDRFLCERRWGAPIALADTVHAVLPPTE